jgi:hypothetical protein
MLDTLLFKTEHIKKLFSILNRLNRSTDVKYEGKCEREIFIRRILNKWFKNKHLIWLCESEQTGVYYNRYITIIKVEYALHYATELNVIFFDYSRPMSLWNEITLDHNKLLDIEGIWCKNNKKHKQILKLTVPNLPLREFVFKTYDFDKYPKRKKKGQTEEDIYKLIESTISFRAGTHKKAYELKKEFEKNQKGKLVICPDIIKIKELE